MLWKVITFVLVGVCIFALGLWLGSIQAEWSKPEHKDAVAYLAMIGGWVSGIATSIAVIISLYATYQSSQNNIEKLSLSYKPYPSDNNESYCANVEVKNMRSVPAHIREFCIEVSGVGGQLNMNKLKANGLSIPYSLYQIGEIWEFAFYPDASQRNMKFYHELSVNGSPTFRSGFFVVKTSMKQYKLRMPKVLLRMMKASYEKQIKIREKYKEMHGKDMDV
ncbi:hypothetical protein RJO21_002744 [Enterobacter hormaechei]|uniref:hypothetical protein n=1 Tax=Enterobacter hormaechei TaxID=158836 RepID=UPI0013720009|nr:hypothetical protein [Enterobacter hormaechei]CAF9451543.1 hypothetical protein AI2904V1_3678 [Enterobacter cloacae]HCJ0092460.1 hypothetical protein [Enterobacter hormaechei subsp. xiangfangensis]ELC6391047.1 hypothetical protein [Enterobacter hormaechei]ELJ5765680.1 hypothetical protein [Enterobacter hormaechei]MXS04273.1 hypothetical protein [Enterobacter hormaechei]